MEELLRELDHDNKDTFVHEIITVETIEETYVTETIITSSDSIDTLADRFSDQIFPVSSKFQPTVSLYTITIQELIHLVVAAMENMIHGGNVKLGIINEKLCEYQDVSSDKLVRREKKMQLAIEYLFEQLEEIETSTINNDKKDNHNQRLNPIYTLLLKVRGIIEEVSVLSQRVGSTEKEVSISRDLLLLVKYLDDLEMNNSNGSKEHNSQLSIKESIIVPTYCPPNMDDDHEAVHSCTCERCPSFVPVENDTITDIMNSSKIIRCSSNWRKLFVETINIYKRKLYFPACIMFWMVFAFVSLLFLLLTTTPKWIPCNILFEDTSLYIPSLINFQLRHYGLPPI